MLTLADRLTLARIVIAPVAVAAYLLLPATAPLMLAFWCCGLLCGLAEFTDWLDGRVARRRGEVSDFGKLADPFCDVIYRIALFLALLLPAGGSGHVPVAALPAWFGPLALHTEAGPRCGLAPFLPVLLMVLRELVAGALRSMTATKGLVLAARTSGKLKAWAQGFAIISILGLPALCLGTAPWQVVYASVVCWICAVLSVGSIIEYLWVNRAVLKQLAQRRPA